MYHVIHMCRVIHITCLEIGTYRAGASNGKKDRPCGLAENLQKRSAKQGFGHERHGRKKDKPYGLAKTFKNVVQNKVLSRSIRWQKKRQTRGRRRRTMESPRAPSQNLGKSKVLPHRHAGGNGDWLRSHSRPCGILRLMENLQRPW